MRTHRAVAMLLALLCAVAAAGASAGTAHAFDAPLVGYGAADGSLICDTVAEINPSYSDVACASGASGWVGATGGMVSFGLVTQVDPRTSQNGGPLDSMAYVVAIAANGVQIATVGVDGKQVNNADYVYAKCFGELNNYTKLVTTASAEGSFAVTAMTGTPYYRVDFDIPLTSLTSCGITPTTDVQLYYGTSAAANLDVINKDYFRTGDSSVNFAGLATIQLGGTLGLSKTVAHVSGPQPPAPGQTTVYDLTITAHDSSMYAVSDLEIADDLPSHVTLVSTSASAGTVAVSGQHVDWSGFGLAAGTSATLTMRVSVSPTNSDVGTALLLNTGATGTALRGDGVAVSATSNSLSTPTVSGPVLTVTKSGAPTFVAAGGTVTYTIVVGNTGNAAAALTSVVDTLPGGFAFVAGSTGGSLGAGAPAVSGGTVTWSGPLTVPAGATRSLTFRAAAGSTAGDYPNTATVSASNAASVSTGPTAQVTVNAAPVAQPDSASTGRATPVSIDVLGNDSDPDGNPLSVTSVSAPSAGTAVVDASTGDVVYAPPAGFSGDATFTYVVGDGYGGADVTTVTVSVANAGPTAADDTVPALPGQPTTVDVLANDDDPDGDTLTVVAVSAAGHGVTSLTSTGAVTYTADASYAGADSFTYTVSDGHGAQDTATVSVSVPNTAPTAADDSAATTVGAPVSIDVLANDADANTAQQLAVLSTSTPQHGAVTIQPDGTLRYTPAAGYAGPDAFDYTVSDGAGGTAAASVTVTVTAGTPVAVDDSATTAADTAVTVDVLANDAASLPLSVVPASITTPVSTPAVGPPGPAAGTAELNDDGTITFTPYDGFVGVASYSYDVTDGISTSVAPATVRITVLNAPPAAVDDAFAVGRQGAQPLDVLANDTDANGDVLTITSAVATASGAVAVVQTGVGGAADRILYTAPGGFTGTDEVRYTVSDGRGGSASAVVTVTVQNIAPAAVADTAAPGTTGPVNVEVLANDSDGDGDPLTISAVTSPADGVVAIEADGTVTYTPDAGFTGTDTFTYTVTDGHGGTATAAVTVTVPNTDPVAGDDIASTTAGSAVDIDVLANDSDINPGQALSVTSAGPAAHGTVTVGANGVVTYTPAGSYQGTDTFAYVVSDGQGGTDTASVEVTIGGRAPVAVADSATTEAETPVTVAVLANDTDADGDALAVVPGSVTTPLAGTTVLNPNGTVTFTPAAGFDGVASFSYTVTDGRYTATAGVSVTVTAPPAPPSPSPSPSPSESPSPSPSPSESPSPSPSPSPSVSPSPSPSPSPSVSPSPSPSPTAAAPTVTAPSEPAIVEPPVLGPPTAPPAAEPAPAPVTNRAPSYTSDPANSTQTLAAPGALAPLAATDPDGQPVRYVLESGQLPPGVELQPNGTFAGTATAPGTYTAVLRVCDDATPPLCSDTQLTVVVQAAVAELPPVGPQPSPPPRLIETAVVRAAPVRPELPRTGAPVAALLQLGLTAVLAGAALTAAAGRRRRG